MRLIIIRHGQTDWNAQARLQGQKDIPLNDHGRGQARRNGQTLAAVAGDLSGHDFVSSPLGRARETMELLRASAGLDPAGYRIDDRLIEISFGDWEGSTVEEVARRMPESVADRERDKWHFLPPGEQAESYAILSHRVGDWLDSVDRPTVAVCHGGVIRCLFERTGTLSESDAAKLNIPQDRILRMTDDGRLEWI